MALSPYKSPQSALNRSRSSSCSSPIRNRFVFQEIFSVGTNTLVRSFSCDQVFDKDAEGKTFQRTQIQVASFITPEKKIHFKARETTPKASRRLAMEPPTDNCEVNKNKDKVMSQPRALGETFRKTVIFTLLTVTSACAFYYYMLYKECSYVWDIEKTEDDLKENVYGQNQVLSRINSVLRMCNNTNDVHVMVFSGGVGVGKTYSSSIIARNFPWSSYKFISYSEFFATDVNKLLNQKLSVCGTNLVIVDDLTAESAKDAINLVILLNNERKKNENLLIILIFQAPTEADANEIIAEFKNSYINAYHLNFKPLTEEAVEMCFRSELKRQSIEISNVTLKNLVDEKTKHVEEAKGPTGCKGVAEEVASYKKKD